MHKNVFWKKGLVIGIICMFLLTISQFVIGIKTLNNNADSTPHEPIYIDGNNDFIIGQNGVILGDGTLDNPYTISGWEINASAADGIFIRNSDVYFLIENCYIHDGKSEYCGIVLKNAVNGEINRINSNINRKGIDLRDNCKKISISNSSFHNNYYCGIHSEGSLIKIINNTVSYNIQDGVDLSSCDSIIEGNIVTNNIHDGIGGNNANNNTYINNTVSSNYRGFIFSNSSQNIFLSNNLSLNSDSGIFLHSCKDNNIIWNTISNNGQGIEFTYSHDNYISKNTITSNKHYNIWFYGWSNTNTIEYNSISSSYIGIFFPEARYNKILRNNIKNNELSANFQSVPNTWDKNYWGRPRLFPKIIFGTILFIPWINIDWNPAKEPYDIPSV